MNEASVSGEARGNYLEMKVKGGWLKMIRYCHGLQDKLTINLCLKKTYSTFFHPCSKPIMNSRLFTLHNNMNKDEAAHSKEL